MLSTYISLEHVMDVNEKTSLYRLDPFSKYLCQWKTEVCQDEFYAINERIQWRHPNLVSFLFYDEVPESFHIKNLKLYYEYMPLDIKQLINKRYQTRSYVPEDEIYKMVQGLVSAFVFLQKKKINHSGLSLETVYFDEEYLIYRIQDVSPFKA